MNKEKKGYYKKYKVFPNDNDVINLTEEIIDPTFTLKVIDEHARVAMLAYAQSIKSENSKLASNLEDLVKEYSG